MPPPLLNFQGTTCRALKRVGAFSSTSLRILPIACAIGAEWREVALQTTLKLISTICLEDKTERLLTCEPLLPLIAHT